MQREPAPDVEFDSRTALIVVDVQNDFADPKGNLYVQGGEQVVPLINQLVAKAASAGSFIVYTQDWHPYSTPHFAKDGGKWPVHCVAGTWGSEFQPDLDVAGPVVQNGLGRDDGYSGFTVRDLVSGENKPTELRTLLQAHDIASVIIVGLALDVCVRETALDACKLGFETSVVLDATKPVEPTAVGSTIEEMRLAGARIR